MKGFSEEFAMWVIRLRTPMKGGSTLLPPLGNYIPVCGALQCGAFCSYIYRGKSEFHRDNLCTLKSVRKRAIASKCRIRATLDDDNVTSRDEFPEKALILEESVLTDDNLSLEEEEVDDEVASVSIEKIAKNKRRICASISIRTSWERVWNVLTDYEGLADFIPGLASSQILEKSHNGARLLQIGEQDLALGVKFRAKGVIEVTEDPAELLPNGIRRDIDFDMVEGDFKIFRGTWRIEQLNSDVTTQVTTLWYILEVQPRIWLPVGLLEGRLAKEVKSNLVCVRDRALGPC